MTVEEQCEREAATAIAELTERIRTMKVNIDWPTIQKEVRSRPEHVEAQREIDRMRAVDRIVFGR